MANAMVVDLSHHNGSVDFAKLKAAGVAGVIHKATQGVSFADPMFAPRRAQAQAAGLLWGAYHFGTDDDPLAQENYFLSKAEPGANDLVALDFEANPPHTMSLAQAKAYLQRLEADLGRRAVLYTGALLRDLLGTAQDSYFGSHRLWWAQYANAPSIQPSWTKYWLWQHSDGFHGAPPLSVDGVGPCDCDTYDGTPAQLHAEWTA
jgi:lysozyme